MRIKVQFRSRLRTSERSQMNDFVIRERFPRDSEITIVSPGVPDQDVVVKLESIVNMQGEVQVNKITEMMVHVDRGVQLHQESRLLNRDIALDVFPVMNREMLNLCEPGLEW